MSNPQLIILLTGTGACAKEFMAKILHCVVGEGRCYTLQLMNAIEEQWSTEDSENNPVLLQQQGGGPVSPDVQMQYRMAMINWSNQIRNMDPGYFCKVACQSAPKRERWFVCGVKRPAEIEWFKTTFGGKVKTVRVSTMENPTKENIWQVCRGDIDDDVIEFDLEDYNYDLKIFHSNLRELSESLQTMVQFMQSFTNE